MVGGRAQWMPAFPSWPQNGGWVWGARRACTDRTGQTAEGRGVPSSRVARYLSVTALRYSM